MITVRNNHLGVLDAAVANPTVIYLFELQNPASFAASLPNHFQAPTQRSPNAGLPANVWVGTQIITHEDVRAAERLLDIHARVRWVEVSALSYFAEKELIDLLSAWRCSNCGQRGTTRRPDRCPHARSLCGDAKILPQIHWLRRIVDETTGWSYKLRAAAVDLDLVLDPDVPVVHELELRRKETRP